MRVGEGLRAEGGGRAAHFFTAMAETAKAAERAAAVIVAVDDGAGHNLRWPGVLLVAWSNEIASQTRTPSSKRKLPDMLQRCGVARPEL